MDSFIHQSSLVESIACFCEAFPFDEKAILASTDLPSVDVARQDYSCTTLVFLPMHGGASTRRCVCYITHVFSLHSSRVVCAYDAIQPSQHHSTHLPCSLPPIAISVDSIDTLGRAIEI